MKGLDWAFAFTHIIPQHRKTFTAVLQRNEELRRLITDLKETKNKLSRLDWTAYSQVASSAPGGAGNREKSTSFVKEMQSSAISFVPKIDVNIPKEYEIVESERGSLINEANEIQQKVTSEIDIVSAKLNRYNDLSSKPIDDFTVNDVYYLEPEFKEEFYQLIRDGCWTDSPQLYAEWKARKAAAIASGHVKITLE